MASNVTIKANVCQFRKARGVVSLDFAMPT
jgi:hypothetical protein